MIAAAIVWTALVLIWATFIYGGHVHMCVGPLNVTPESCRAVLGLPPETDWDRFVNGWGLLATVTAAGWAVILVYERWRRQRGGL